MPDNGNVGDSATVAMQRYLECHEPLSYGFCLESLIYCLEDRERLIVSLRHVGQEKREERVAHGSDVKSPLSPAAEVQ